jgi:tetratricopeptide (TPR) repeat protein
MPERLQVFVSSTIKECAAERKVAKRAISSLNHDPILFEHIGARSTPPRHLYLQKLDESNIFIGIYRNSYGWAAPGSTVSGIEDEFHRSGQRGMPRLIYVLDKPNKRDPRLSALLDNIEAEGEITYSTFRTAEELYDRIREDIEAEVAKRFNEAERLEAIVHANAAMAVSGLVPAPKAVLLRPQLGEDLLALLAARHVVQVFGELGIGKTVFLASFAKERNLVFVSGTELSNHELASVLANKLASVRGLESRYFLDASSAYSALLESWRTTDAFTIVIDDCQDLEFVAALLRNAGATSAKRLIYSIRNADASYGHSLFPIPPLSLTEVTEFLEIRGLKMSAEALDAIHRKSGGNPLYLLYFSQAPEASTQQTLSEYELTAWRQLSPSAHELAEYLAIANQRIPLAEMLALVGRRESTEEVTDALQEAQVFVAEFPSGYTLRHEHQRATILEQLAASPSKFAYYSGRVAKLLQRRRDYLRAYFVLRQTDKGAAEQISRLALFDSQRRYDVRAQLVIINDILETTRPSDPRDLMVLLASKVQALHHSGEASKVAGVLADADALAATSSDPLLKLRAREVRITFAAATDPAPQNLGLLQQLEQEYLKHGDRWSAARLTSELSVLFTATRKFSESLEAAERGLRIFQELGDEHGISVSLRNKAIALAEIPGKEAEGAELFRQLQKKQETSGTQRERAWLCNYMVRTLRRGKQFSEALRYGQEAVRIGEELGDLHLIATNRLSLGNVYRDMREWDKALDEYAASGELGGRYGDKTIESSAARLAAAVYRRKGNNRLALEHALLSVSAVEGTVAFAALADAYEETGDCHFAMREWAQAAESYAKAAAVAEDIEEKSRLTVDSLSTCVYQTLGPTQYLRCLNAAYDYSVHSDEPFAQQLFAHLGDMLKRTHVDYAIRLFGLHFRVMFKGAPSLVERFLFGQVLKELLAQSADTELWRLLFPAIPLLVSVSDGVLNIHDLVQLGDRVHDRVSGVHFKPQDEGSSWVLALNLRQPVILTVTCLDDRTDTFTAAALLAFFFKGFDKNIAEMLSVPEIPKRELDIFVGSIESMPADLRSRFPAGFETCAVTRPASQNDHYIPMFVVCQEDVGKQWRAGTGSSSALQSLLGQVLTEAAFQLLKGAVDMATLEPKIIEILRKTLS